jgi:glutamine amidotransferase
MRVTILDYGAGNLHSLSKAIAGGGADVRVVTDVRTALESDVLVWPGVGAFGPASATLAPFRDSIRDAINAGLPVLGVCLGMQLLFDESDEAPGSGLGVFPGRVERLREPRVPQMGWNTVRNDCDSGLTQSGLTTAYYANSYVCRPTADSQRSVTAWSTYGNSRFPAVIRSGRVVGVQFHPEKSSVPGVAFLASVIREIAA